MRLTGLYTALVAPEIFVKLALSAEDCHWIVPVWPLSVRVSRFVPVHNVLMPEIVPATDAALTVINADPLLAAAQTPLATTAQIGRAHV